MLPFELTKDTPYLALLGELWSVFCEYFNRNWPCYKGFLLYLHLIHFHPGTPMSVIWISLRTYSPFTDVFITPISYGYLYVHTLHSQMSLSHQSPMDIFTYILSIHRRLHHTNLLIASSSSSHAPKCRNRNHFNLLSPCSPLNHTQGRCLNHTNLLSTYSLFNQTSRCPITPISFLHHTRILGCLNKKNAISIT